MKPSEFIKDALRTDGTLNDKGDRRIEHAIMGLVTEAGELTDALKRYKFYKQKLDRVNLIEEAGDIMWYLAILCDELGVSFETVWEKTIRKLKTRYPEKYTHKNAKIRNLQKERKELEK